MPRFIAVLAVLLAALALLSEARAYGALALARPQDGSGVVALITRPNEADAARDAMAVCERIARRRGGAREECRMVRAFTNLCMAVAADQRHRLFTAQATENYWARVRAQDQCRRAGGRNCSVVRSLCDTTVNRPRGSAELAPPPSN